jgi:hypothetical protein
MAKGKKTGGRKPGSKNRTTLLLEKHIADRRNIRKTPLDYMLEQMNMPFTGAKTHAQRMAVYNLRLRAAAEAAPYLHPRLMAVQHNVLEPVDDVLEGGLTPDNPKFLEIVRRIAFVMALGARAANAKAKQEDLPSATSDV